MDRNKGQAAMEFLMTYGWAILAAIIAIGVLAYFGIFSPGRFVQESVNVNAPFNAPGVVVNSADIDLEILNGAGETVNITSIAITNCNAAGEDIGASHATGSRVVYTIPCTPALISGDTFRGDVTLNYIRSGSTLELQSTGTITARVR